MDSAPFVVRQPRVASAADAATKLAPKALQEPMVTIRAESTELGLDFQLSLPFTDQKGLQDFPFFITELAQAITRGSALNMRQSVEMHAWENALVRSKQSRRERHEFYAEVQKNFEQLAGTVQQMKRDYYREIDHLREQLREQRNGRPVHPEEVIFFDPSGYQVPTWESIVELLDSRRKSRELESGHSGGGGSRVVPMQMLCKSCRDNFHSLETTDAPLPVEASTQTEEPKSDAGVVRTGNLVSRWAQTERSGAGPEMSEGSMQTEDWDLPLPTSSTCQEQEEQAGQEEQKEEAPGTAQTPAVEAPAQISVSVGVQAELAATEDAADALMLATSQQMERQSLRQKLKEALAATEVGIAKARREKDEEWGHRLEALRRELEERMASASEHMASAAAADAAAAAAAAAAATADAVKEAVAAVEKGIWVGSDSQRSGDSGGGPTSEELGTWSGASESVGAPDGCVLEKGVQMATVAGASKGDSTATTTVSSMCPKVSCNNVGSGLSLKQRKQMAARMLERRLAALQAHMQRSALARARLCAPLELAPSNAPVGGEDLRASVPSLSPPSASQSPSPASQFLSPVPPGSHRPRSMSDPHVRPFNSSASQAGGGSPAMQAAQSVSGSFWNSVGETSQPQELGGFVQVQVKQMGFGSFGGPASSSPAPQGRHPGPVEPPSMSERGRRGPYPVQPPELPGVARAPIPARRRAPGVAPPTGWRNPNTEVAASLGKSRDPSPGGPPVSRGEALGPVPMKQMDFMTWANTGAKERGTDVAGAFEVALPQIPSKERSARSSSPAQQWRGSTEALPSLLSNPRPRHKEMAGGA